MINVNDITDTMVFEINKAIMKKVAQKPNLKLLNLEDVTVENIASWLETFHSVEWGRFSVKDYDDKIKVADWFRRNLYEFYAYLNMGV